MRKFALLVLVVVFGWSSGAVAAPIEWVEVGSPGNTCESQTQGCMGGVDYEYRVSKFEVTNAQYMEFLNHVAVSDPYGLYAPTGYLGGHGGSFGGIVRSGSPGSYSYSGRAGWEDKPVTYTSFYDAIRFANWMHNGQGVGDTENGAYTITAAGIATNSIERNAGATFFLPSDEEWYKAAYFDESTSSYFEYPTASDTTPTCAMPSGTPNTASCNLPNGASATFGAGGTVEVGTYTNSSSPFGTFNQTGNVGEWVEVVVGVDQRGQRGTSWTGGVSGALAESRGSYLPDFDHPAIGFRMAAAIPEPSTALLLGVGLAGLGTRRRG